MDLTAALANPRPKVQRLLNLAQTGKLDTLVADRNRRRAQTFQSHKLVDRLDQATIDQIVVDYQAGASSLELAERYDIGKASVLKLLTEQGIEIRHQSLTDEQLATATDLYLQGLSLAKVGQHFGRDASFIHITLRRAGVPMRDRHRRVR